MVTFAYTPNTRQVEDYFSENRDFPICPHGASKKYVLCSSPRSGSTLIASMLHETGLAGDPLEYLNEDWINVYLQSSTLGSEDFDADRYLAMWETRRTSPNGLFGIKLHHHQMRRIWRGRDQEAVNWFGSLDQRVLLTRRDKVAQAVSLYRALTTQVWSSQDSKYPSGGNPPRNRAIEFNAVRIAELLTFLIKEEEGWRNFMKAKDLPFAELCYEDFVKDYVGESQRLLKLLDIELDVSSIPPPPLTRQSRENDPLIEQFKRAIGFGFPGESKTL